MTMGPKQEPPVVLSLAKDKSGYEVFLKRSFSWLGGDVSEQNSFTYGLLLILQA